MLTVLSLESHKALGCFECVFFSIALNYGCNHPGPMIKMRSPLECDSRRVAIKGMTKRLEALKIK